MLTVLLIALVGYAALICFALALGKASATGERVRESWAEYFEAVADYELDALARSRPRRGRFTRRVGERSPEAPDEITPAAA